MAPTAPDRILIAAFMHFTDRNASTMYIRITYAVWISALHAEENLYD